MSMIVKGFELPLIHIERTNEHRDSRGVNMVTSDDLWCLIITHDDSS